MKNMSRKPLLLSVIVAAALCSASRAATVFTNEAAFLAALGTNQPSYLNDFADLAATGYVAAPRSYTNSGMIYSLNCTPSLQLYSLGGAVAAPTGLDSLLVTPTSGNIVALGGNLYLTDASGARVAGQIQVSLSDGTTTNLTCAASGALPFVGFVSSNTVIASLTVPPTAANTYPTLDNLYVATRLVVTTNADSGFGSLREAINVANSHAGPDTITFNLPGTNVQTIAPLTALPTITGPVVMDGYTQPGAAAGRLGTTNPPALRVHLTGTNITASASGLAITTSNCVVRGLAINSFRNRGISLSAGASSNRIEGCFIGTDPSGTLALTNDSGIEINWGAGNTVGAVGYGAGNLLSGNTACGLLLKSGSSTNNVVLGNFIGLDITGTNALGNNEGLGIQCPWSLFASNVISGNRGYGVRYWTVNAHNNRFEGNFVGTDVSGQLAVSNTLYGVILYDLCYSNVLGGRVAGSGNLISGNGQGGIDINGSGSTNNVVEGNFIGTDSTGTKALRNVQNGVLVNAAANNVIGGTETAARNIISGNTGAGVSIAGTGATNNVIAGNFIGVDATGSYAVSNLQYGVTVSGVAGNTIGGDAPGARNVISGNRQSGVQITGVGGSNNVVAGNFIGVDATGTYAISNAQSGVYINNAPGNTVGGTTPGARNIISGNGAFGVVVYYSISTNNAVLGNYIGVDASGANALGNKSAGVAVGNAASFDRIGGVLSGEGNLIAFNNGNGVQVNGGATNICIRGNAIFSNTSLGIDLGANGVTANDTGDADTGANQFQNYPALSSATAQNGIVVLGSLSTATNIACQLDFYASDSADASGYGEGQTYLGSATVTTDATGNQTFGFGSAMVVPLGKWITATATDPFGNTSEFSRAIQVIAPPQFTASSVVGSSNAFSAQLTGLASGARVVIESTEDLQTWWPLSTNTENRGVVSFTNAPATNYPHLFFRARLLP
jgi:hypothetical protein